MLNTRLKTILFIVIVCCSCVKDQDFDVIKTSCDENLMANATFAEVKSLYNGELYQIQEDLVIEGYVISSDRAGNFFGVLHFQNRAENPTEGFQIGIDLFESHLLFAPGSKIFIRTKGLFLGQSRGVFRLGGTFSGFGTTSVGRLPAHKIPEHIFLACGSQQTVEPTKTTIDSLQDDLVNTLVRLENVEVGEEELTLPFAEPREETERTLFDCDDNTLVLLNSGFSDFHAEPLPEGNGSATGVLLKENDDFLLVIRDTTDIDFSNERCVSSQMTSDRIFFSELADPNNNTGARFVELYNASSQPLDFDGWTIRRYTNDNIEVGSTIDLSGFSIEAENTFVISPDAAEFEAVYGFAPDLGVGSNSPADSNGDDNLELVDPFGTIIDVFGIPGEDGSGTNHEFEDGRAVRKAEIMAGNPTYTFAEWIVFNDTGNAGTINIPQNAPEDFSPGLRE